MMLKASVIGCLLCFGGGALLHQVVLPEPGPEALDHPGTGQIIENRFAGERIVIEQSRQDTDGQSIRLHLTLEPRGSVPSAHVHSNLDERFTVLAQRLPAHLFTDARDGPEL